ncbi:TPA: type VII secretion protein EsaA [Streptococcus agalactiae]
MKRNNFRILWYIIAVALFLVAIAGLNLKLQGDHAKENKTTQSATNTKLNIALVNEDQNVSNGKESYNLGASYIKSIERDNSQNWSVVSRGTAQNGLNKGDYQLMVIIPNNFSQKLLDVNKANAEQTTISYKVNAKGNLALEKKATEKGKDIVSELNSHLVNMYMASILSNLYTAQENVQAMVNVQSGNISNYQKNLLDSATNFQNIFPALVNQSSSSITANESLKKSLEASDNMFNDLVTTQTNTGKDLSRLIEQRHQDSISYEAFSASLLEMNNELLEKQLSDIITQAQKDQEILSSQLNSIMGDDNDNDHNHKENSSAYLNVARQKIQELSEALKSQDNVAKDQSEQLDKIVREGLASYFAKNNKDNITLLELLKSHSTNEKTLKDFKAKVADFTNSLISSIPSLNLSELHLTQEEEKAIQFTSSDSEIIKKVSNERTLYLNTNLLNRLFEARKNRDEAKNKVNQLKLPSSSTRTGEQIVSVESNNPDYRVDTWTVNGKQTRTLDPSQNNNIIINSSYQGESSNSSITKPSYTITIGNHKQIVQNDDGKTQRSYLEAEATYQRTLQEVIDAYNTTHGLVAKYYIISDGEEPQNLFDQFLNQSVNDTMVDLVKNGITKYLMDENTADAQQKVKDVMEEVENSQDELADQMAKVTETNVRLTDAIKKQLETLQSINMKVQNITQDQSKVNDSQKTTDQQLSDLKNQLDGLMTSAAGVKDMSKSNSQEADQVNQIFTSFNKDVQDAKNSGNKLSTDATDLMANFQKELANNGDFVASFSKVFNTAYKNGVPNDILLNFLSRPVAESASAVRATENTYRPFTWILLLEVVSLFTAYIFATQNLIKKLTDRYNVNRWLQTDFLNVIVISGLSLVIGLALGVISSRSLHVMPEYVPSWFLVMTLFSFLLIHSQYFFVKNFKAVGMGLALFMIISFVYLSNAVGTVATVSGLPKLLKAINPLSILENQLSSYFDNVTTGFIFLILVLLVDVAFIIMNIFITLNFEAKVKE